MAAPIKIEAELINRIDHSDKVLEFHFKPKGRFPKFKAGQFLHLALDEYDPSFEWPESRVFSIASGSRNQEFIRIVVSVKGSFTKKMKDELFIGREVWLKLPYGDFIINDCEEIVLIAGGTGIAPYISFLENKLIEGFERRINLYYGIAKYENLIFEKLLDTAIKYEKFNMVLYLEEQAQNNNFCFKEGRLNIYDIIDENKKESLYYLSGPFLMIKDFREILLNNNIKKENIRIDDW